MTARRRRSNDILAAACTCACALSACTQAGAPPPLLTVSVNELMVEWTWRVSGWPRDVVCRRPRSRGLGDRR